MNALHALRICALAAALGLTTVIGHGVATADDGTGAPAPGPSSADGTSVDDDATAPPLKTSGTSTSLGNGRIPGDPSRFGGAGSIMSGLGGISSGATQYDAATKAEADEIRDMEHLVEMSQYSDEYQEQMFELMADMRSTMAEIAANTQNERVTAIER
ncbi:hypothetical protein EV580_1503 [Mycobacterium sp. BK086]|uniref:hypothetical protein n=1 Tax=Mycobacterium sp. BK086 TaxID=2512165 RepID=UPI00105FEC15|nr:hypothetical protein [Mycobacterium sp. BK086]TDO18317.1 hypothetical protein EV580_1503 [Mycobacterium sp. BK086]